MTPYRPVLGNSTLRRLLPGLALSALGDGMAGLAVSWLALQLATPSTRGTWVAAAVAAYTLPSVLGTVIFGLRLARWDGARLAGGDAALRAVCLGAIPIAYVVGTLTPSCTSSSSPARPCSTRGVRRVVTRSSPRFCRRSTTWPATP